MNAMRRKFSSLRLGILALIVLPCMCLLLTPFMSSDGVSPRLHSSSNIRSTIQSITLWSQSNHGRFPETADNWQQILIDAAYATPEMFVSPLSDGLGDDYFFVPGGRDDFDKTRVVVYEDPALDKHCTLIGYADAHVEFVNQNDAMRILSNLTLPDGTRYAPHESDPSSTAP